MLKFAIVQICTTQKSANNINQGFFLFQRANTHLNENLAILPPYFSEIRGQGGNTGPSFECTGNVYMGHHDEKLEIEMEVHRVVFESFQRKETSESHSDCL